MTFARGLLARLLGRGRARPSGEPLPVVLFTKAVCPLCDEAKRELGRVQTAIPWSLEVVSIDGDADLERLHGQSVPVISIAGRPAFKGRVTAVDFTRKLAHRSAQESAKQSEVAS